MSRSIVAVVGAGLLALTAGAVRADGDQAFLGVFA
jgi:hypothetical protein